MSFYTYGCSMHIQLLYIWYVNCINIYIFAANYIEHIFSRICFCCFLFSFFNFKHFVILLYNICEYRHTHAMTCGYQRTSFESEFPLLLGFLGSNSSDQADTVACNVTH